MHSDHVSSSKACTKLYRIFVFSLPVRYTEGHFMKSCVAVEVIKSVPRYKHATASRLDHYIVLRNENIHGQLYPVG